MFHVTRDEDVFDGATRTGATKTAGLGHAELGQRDWDTRYKDNLFVFFVIRMLKENFSLRLYVITVVTNTTVESLR